MKLRGQRVAPGAPGISAAWAPGSKEGFGTALSLDSRIWFTLCRGVVTELYYPEIDRPQTRGLEYAVTDGATFFHDEDRHLLASTFRPDPDSLDYKIVSSDPEGRYSIEKEVLSDPDGPSLLLRTRLILHRPELRGRLRLFVSCLPHLDGKILGSDAAVYDLNGTSILTARRENVALAIGAAAPFRQASVGYIGRSDGLSALKSGFTLGSEWDLAPGGSVGLAAEIDLSASMEHVLAVSFGPELEAAVRNLSRSLRGPFDAHRDRFRRSWRATTQTGRSKSEARGNGSALARASRMVLLSHEDKAYPGAFIASPSIPWGWARADDPGGYHLVWTRDLVHVATALLASGDREAPRRALTYLAARQREDGSFPQNFWLDGRPYGGGLQLDEVALPIVLAWQLERDQALGGFDPYPMVLRAARFLVERGPVTQEDRWEELSGFSPSTLGLQISALLGASDFARRRGDLETASFLEETADFLEEHLESWTVTDSGVLDPETPRHYVRIRPALPSDPTPREFGPMGMVHLPNLPAGALDTFPAEEIVSTEFLSLVRYGIREALDPTVVDSVRLVDRFLRTDTPYGPAWKRYNHDGYGQGPGGAPYVGWGIGRSWPLLTGERGHYELAAGRDATPYARAMERFATDTGLLTEQIWDEPDRPERGLAFGRPTGAAMPLAWAHAEYLLLLRSIDDGRVFDRIPPVVSRYLSGRRPALRREVWKFNRQIGEIDPGRTLRIQAEAPFLLRWSDDDWRTARQEPSHSTPIGLHYLDLAPLDGPGGYRFTFRWPLAERWEGRDFAVAGRPASP